MSETIKHWIVERLGIIVDVESEAFLHMVQDGYLIAQVLHSLGVIDKEQLTFVRSTGDSEAAFDHIVIWLKSVGFSVDDETRRNIARGKISAAVGLFYKLYLAFKDKDKLYFMSKQAEGSPCCDLRFHVESVPEELRDSSNVGPHHLSKPLEEYAHVLHWHKARHSKLLVSCKKLEDDYKKHVLSNLDDENHAPDAVPESLEQVGILRDGTYDELVAQRSAALDIRNDGVDPKIAKQIVNKIKRKAKRKKDDVAIETLTERIVTDELWGGVVKSLRSDFESDVLRKLLKQSRFERQISASLLDVRKQKNIMTWKRKLVDQEIQQKNDDLLLEKMFLKIKETEDEAYKHYLEQNRALQLNRLVHEEKLRLKQERKRDMCYQIVEDLVDLALFRAEYFGKYADVLNRCKNSELALRLEIELSALFSGAVPISSSIEDPTGQSKSEETEESHPYEIERHEATVEQYFQNYCNFELPWKLSERAPDFLANLEQIQLGKNILGHIVFRLLLTKYPKPAPPPFTSKLITAVCLDGITDSNAVAALSELLADQRIKVIRLEDGINYCLEAYKFVTEHPEMQFVNEELRQGSGQSIRSERESANNMSNDNPPILEKALQTPDVFPSDEEVQVKPAVELGRLAYVVLNLGEALNDKLLIKIFVEYLKSLEDIDGWVLINYPQNFEQASILEEELTGKPVIKPIIGGDPIANDEDPTRHEKTTSNVDDIVDLDFRNVPQNDPDDDKNAKFRKSRLLTNPDVEPKEEDHGTCLTGYVRLVQSTNEQSPSCASAENGKQFLVDRFYDAQGVLNTYHYNTYDLPTLEHLSKLIASDYSLPPKTSTQVFGDLVSYSQTDFDPALSSPVLTSISAPSEMDETEITVHGKGKGSNKQKGKSEATKKVKKGKVDAETIRTDRETQVPEIRRVVEKIHIAPVDESKPGEMKWKYVDLPLADEFQVALATLWENLEQVYVDSFSDVIRRTRSLWALVVPYMNQVNHSINEVIATPDDAQTHFGEFQRKFNETDDGARNDDEVKSELLQWLDEFREGMTERYNERMRVAEDERAKIIGQDWLTKVTCKLTNAYVGYLQMEIDRCAETLRLLSGYYIGTITPTPTTQELVLRKTKLTCIPLAKELGLKTFSSFVGDLLERGISASSDCPFRKLFADDFDVCVKDVGSYQKAALGLVTGMDVVAKPKPTDSKSKPGKTISETGQKEISSKLMEEWKCAIIGEILRTKCRLSVIKSFVDGELLQILDYPSEIFGDVKSRIIERHDKDVAKMQSACDVFSKAAEEEVAVQGALILEADAFYIDPFVQEGKSRVSFTLQQLDRLVDVFLGRAPDGILSERTFSELMQDMKTADCFLPLMWRYIRDEDFYQISSYYFGCAELIDWRDFVIYNARLEFPTEEELLETRRQFLECDTDSNESARSYRYGNVTFWFEKYFDVEDSRELLRLEKLIELLYKIYGNFDGTVNYMELLFGFCKDKNPLAGVVKALELVLGKPICWQMEVGELCKGSRAMKKQERSAKTATIKTAREILDSLMNKIFGSVGPENVDDVTFSSVSKTSFASFDSSQSSIKSRKMLFFLPFDALAAVLIASMPWVATTQIGDESNFLRRIEIAYEACRNPEFGDLVLAHEFLNSAAFQDLLKDTFKFAIRDPNELFSQRVTR